MLEVVVLLEVVVGEVDVVLMLLLLVVVVLELITVESVVEDDFVLLDPVPGTHCEYHWLETAQ